MAVTQFDFRMIVGLISVCVGLASCNTYQISDPTNDVQIRMLDRNGNSSSGRSIPSANRAFLERQRRLAEASAEARSGDRPLILDNSAADVGIVQHVPTADAAELDTRVGKIGSDNDGKIISGNLQNNETASVTEPVAESKPSLVQTPERRLITANKVSYQDIFADVQSTSKESAVTNQEELITIAYPQDNQKVPASKVQVAVDATAKSTNSTAVKQAKTAQRTSNTPQTASNDAKPKISNTKRSIGGTGKQYFIQGGSYKNSTSAEKQLKSYRKTGYPVEIRSNKTQPKLYRVMIGPFANRAAADRAMEKVIEQGFFDVFVKTE